MAQGIKADISEETLSNLLKINTIKEIAEKLNVSEATIKRYKTKYNLKTNINIAKQRNSEKHTIYKCNKNYFNTIDTLNKAYLLGFLCADGFITDRNEIGIGVSLKDIDVVKFFQQELQSDKPIKIEEDIQYPTAELRIQNYQLVEDIKRYEIVPRKSLILDISKVIQLAKLNDKQISVFLLGYFDGDGCISIAHNQTTQKEYFEMNITGTRETIEYYKKYFDNHGTITKRHQDNKNNFTLQMSNNYSTIYNALNKIYKYKNEITFCLDRKYQKFEKLKNKVLLNSDI